MNFFEHQDLAKKNSKKLVVMFGAAVIGVIAAVYFAAYFAMAASGNSRSSYDYEYDYQYDSAYYGEGDGKDGTSASPEYTRSTPTMRRDIPLWDPEIFTWASGLTLIIIALGSMFKSAQLKKGGGYVARMLGGTLVDPATTDLDERKLINVVEEMAIAAGVPVPEIYLLRNEPGINAFAAGHNNDDVAIGVTRGCVQTLSRDELQGVIAHEFSHIINGDMRLNIRLMGVVHGILVIGLIGYMLLRSLRYGRIRMRGRNGGAAVAGILVVGLTLIIIGYAGVFFGNLIKAAVSRQREYLADASAVQFTRNPDGIGGALLKIGGFAPGAVVTAPNARQASHLFFGSALSSRFLFKSALATHPPIEKRIKAIRPNWDGVFPSLPAGYHAEPDTAQAVPGQAGLNGAGAGAAAGLAAATSAMANQPATAPASTAPPTQLPPPGQEPEFHVTPEEIVDSIGMPTPAHVSYSAALLRSFPDSLREAARTRFGAEAVIYSLLIDRNPEIAKGQVDHVKANAAPEVVATVAQLTQLVHQLGARARLPLIDLSMPALRKMTAEEYAAFSANVQVLVDADGRVDLFEYALQKALLRHLGAHFEPPRKTKSHFQSPKVLADECILLLSTLAYAGHETTGEAASAYGVAVDRLDLATQRPPLLPATSCKMTAFDYAVGRINEADPRTKQEVLTAAAYCVAADGVVTIEEAELLRAVSDALDSPMPPFLA